MAGSGLTNDRNFCQEQVRRILPTFRLTIAYAPPGLAPRLLALYALMSAIEEAVSAVSDAAVARTKLAWWHQELLGQPPSESNHPIVRYLLRSGALEHLPAEYIAETLRLALARSDRGIGPTFDPTIDPTIDQYGLADFEALEAFCGRLGMNLLEMEMAMEMALVQATQPADAVMAAAARLNGLVQLIRESCRAGHLGCWWMPLQLSARYGVPRGLPMAGMDTASGRQLLQAVCREGLSWQPDWRAAGRAATQRAAGRGERPPPLIHWWVHSRLQARQLQRLSALPPARMAPALRRSRPADAWLAWRFARRLGRAS